MAQHVLLLVPDDATYAAHDAALCAAGFLTHRLASCDDPMAGAHLLVAEASLLRAPSPLPRGLLLFFRLPLDDAPALEFADGQLMADAEPAAVVRVACRIAREGRLRAAARAHGIGTYEFDFVAGRGTYSPEAKALFGVRPEAEIPLDGDLLPLAVHPDDRARVLDAFRRALVPGATGEVETDYRIRRADGGERHLEVRSQIVFEETGSGRRPVWATGMLRDVTAERHVMARLAGAGRFFREAVEQAPVPVIVHALDDGEILALSDVVVRALGWSREELRSGVDWFMRVHGMARDAAERALAGTLARFREVSPASAEHEVRSRDGRVRRWRFEGSRALRLADGRPFAVSVAWDVTEHVSAERELERTNALLDAIFSEAPVGLAFWDREFRFRRINAELAEMNGLPPAAHVGRTPVELLPDLADLEQLMARWQRLLETGEPFEIEVSGATPAAPGRTRYWKERFFPVRVAGEIVGLSGVVDEITEQREAERRQRESESRFRQFAENIEDVLWMSVPHAGRLLYVSPAFERIWGLSCEALYTDFSLWSEAIHPEHRTRVRQAFQRFGATGEGYDEQYPIVRPDGTTRWIRDRGFAVRDPDGRQLYAAGIAEDITARRRTEERLLAEERRYHEIFEAAGTAMWELDFTTVRDELDALAARGVRDVRAHVETTPGELERLLAGRRVLDVNTAALQLHGTTSRDALASHILALGTAPWRETMLRTLEAVAAGDVRIAFETAVTDVGGRSIDVLASVSISPPGERPVRVLFNLSDVSALKRAETVLREANQRKDEFLAMLAHELRNPLAPIRNAAEALRLARTEEPVVTWARDMIGRQVAHLARIVDDLLDISRIIQGKAVLHREAVDLRAVVRGALETSRPLIDARGHAVELGLPAEAVVVDGDFVRLAQVVSNLLTNSAKYTPTAGRITVTLAAADGAAVLRVADTGEGLAPELLTEVFDLFTQAHRTIDRSQGGLGIGLTIVKRLVELHGGTVQASSDGPGKGSTFTVHLPVLASPPAPEAPAEAPAAGQAADGVRRLRVLVLDDNRDAADSLAELLRLSGYEVRTAEDGPTALEVADVFRPDVGLLDLGLPGMDGFQLASQLRARPAGAGLLLVAVTGYGRDEDVRQALASGFDHHMVKPVELAALRALLENRRPSGATPSA